MADFLLRPALPGDTAALSQIWQAAFHDPAPLVQRMLMEGGLLRHAVAAEVGGRAVSAMFAFPGLTVCGKPAAYLYALCTLPEYRGRGLGAAVLDAIAHACFSGGAALVFLSPADAGLSRWYQGLGFLPLGAVEDVTVPLSPAEAGVCVPVTPEEYAALRRAPAGVTQSLLQAQGILLEAEGGGFFRLELPGGSALACAVPRENGLLVLELLCPEKIRACALQTLSGRFSTAVLRLRCAGEAGHRLLYRSACGGPTDPLPSPAFPFLMD